MPGGHHHVDDVARPAAGAEGDLRERAEVGVVVELDAGSRAGARAPRRPGYRPSRAGRSSRRLPFVAVDRRRERHAGADDAASGRRPPRRARSAASSAAASSASCGRLVDVELDEALGEDGGGEVGDGDPDVAVAEVDAERRAGRARRAAGGPAGGRGPRGAARSSGCSTMRPAPLQVGDERVATVVRESPVRRARSLRLGGSGPAQRVDDPEPVELPQCSRTSLALPSSTLAHAALSNTFAGIWTNFALLSGGYTTGPALKGKPPFP